MNKWGWHYEKETEVYVFYDMKDGEAKIWIAAEVAESSSCTCDPHLHRLIARVKLSRVNHDSESC